MGLFSDRPRCRTKRALYSKLTFLLLKNTGNLLPNSLDVNVIDDQDEEKKVTAKLELKKNTLSIEYENNFTKQGNALLRPGPTYSIIEQNNTQVSQVDRKKIIENISSLTTELITLDQEEKIDKEKIRKISFQLSRISTDLLELSLDDGDNYDTTKVSESINSLLSTLLADSTDNAS